jgi:HAD superfamily hydrolase (TIGR01490 family)
MILALFDFDGTITKKDSLIDFIKYAVGINNYYIGIVKLSPMLVLYSLGLIKNNIAKEKMITYFFSGFSIEKFQNIANKYSLEKIDFITRKSAIARIEWHKKQKHRIIVVSASMENWLEVWCNKNNIELIATKLEVVNKVISGKFASKNCYGVEKVNRIKGIIDLNSYEYIYAYGDSCGDKELLEIANEKFYKFFKE